MSTYEVLTLLALFGTFLVALLAYIDSRNNKRKKTSLPCTWPVEVGFKTYHEVNHFVGGRSLHAYTITRPRTEFKKFFGN